MQKTEKHCKNQCFLLSQNDEKSVRKRVQKTQKSASGPGHLRNRKKRCCKPKNWGQKVEKHGFFHFSLADFGRARSRTGVFRTVFLQCFLKASVTTYQKQEVLAEKCPPPPGKPVTFYECHPEDHAPAPSVRADLHFGWGILLSQEAMETRIQAGGGGNELSYDKNTIWWLWENWDLMGFNGI